MTQEETGLVVVGVDGGPGSAGALRYAVEEARRTGAELRLVHVSPTYPPAYPMMPALPEQIARAGDEILQRAQDQVAEMAPGLRVSVRRLIGPRIVELVNSAADADLLVIGHETRSAVERMFGAGTTAAVAAHTDVPVVVVPAEWEPGSATGPVVAGLKSEEHADELLGVAFARAAASGAPLRVVHAWKLPDEYIDLIEARTHREYWEQRGTDLLEKALAPWRERYPDVEVKTEVVHDEPACALVDASLGASLVVLVRRPPVKVLGHHLGGTGRAVLKAVSCPVEVVPARAKPAVDTDLELEKAGTLLR